MTFVMVHTQRTVRVKCAVYPMLHHPPPPMHKYGQRATQNGRLWVTFFVTKCRDLFCDQGGGGAGGVVQAGPPPLYPSLPRGFGCLLLQCQWCTPLAWTPPQPKPPTPPPPPEHPLLIQPWPRGGERRGGGARPLLCVVFLLCCLRCPHMRANWVC